MLNRNKSKMRYSKFINISLHIRISQKLTIEKKMY